MTLRVKVVTILVLCLSGYGVVDYALKNRVIYPSFIALEREAAQKDLARCAQAIGREVEQVATICQDYGGWDDTAQFVVDANAKYVDANLVPSNLKAININFVYVCDLQGKVVGSQTISLDTGEVIAFTDIPKDRVPMSHALMQIKNPKDTIDGILFTGSGPALVASRPVLNNAREGPVRGVVIMGRLLNEVLVSKLRLQTEVGFEVRPAIPIQSGSGASDMKAVRVFLDDSRSNVLVASAALGDVEGRLALPLRAEIPRQITARGRATMHAAALSLVGAGLVLLVVLLLSLQWSVLGPVSRLKAHAVRVGRTDDLTSHLREYSNDELGTLAAEFDRMVGRLADARKKLVEQSYASGVAEMASGTLHNVRNTLTPMLAELDLLRQELAKVPMDQIDMARKELGGGNVPDARRSDLARFVDLAEGRLLATARDTHAKLEDVTTRAKRIEEFLSTQEQSSRAERPLEWVALAELVGEAAALLSADRRGQIVIDIGPDLAGSGPARVDRVGMLQVFNNLLLNAAEAIEASGRQQGAVRIDLKNEVADGAAMIHLSVADDGEGIAPENLARIFERGFSTRTRGSRGTGLHWCANRVAAMGGRLFAESDGPGRGACLHVLIPQAAEKGEANG